MWEPALVRLQPTVQLVREREQGMLQHHANGSQNVNVLVRSHTHNTSTNHKSQPHTAYDQKHVTMGVKASAAPLANHSLPTNCWQPNSTKKSNVSEGKSITYVQQLLNPSTGRPLPRPPTIPTLPTQNLPIQSEWVTRRALALCPMPAPTCLSTHMPANRNALRHRMCFSLNAAR